MATAYSDTVSVKFDSHFAVFKMEIPWCHDSSQCYKQGRIQEFLKGGVVTPI